MTDRPATFEECFWGGGLKGLDTLMGNLKCETTASKELMELMKERSFIEDIYAKSLLRLFKSLSQVPETNLGAFHPVWLVMVEALESLGKVHAMVSETFEALHREVADYHHTQKDSLKKNTKGEIESARDTYVMFDGLESAVHKSKRQYETCANEVAALHCDMQSAPPKVKEKLEEKLKKSDIKLKDACAEHKEAVSQHCGQVMEVQGKMKEALQKFQSLEEDHLSQMILFTIKYSSSVDYKHQQSQAAHSTMCGKMNTLPSDLLVSRFALKRGTGSERPNPFLFKEIVISDLVRTMTQESAQGEGRLKPKGRLFSKRAKRASTDSHHSFSASASSPRDPSFPGVPGQVSEIDEDGYSIRPVDADRITGFGQQESAVPSSGSDSDDEQRNKFKNLTIKSRDHVKTATDEELLSIKLQGPQGSAGKSGSSASLDVLGRRGHDSKDGSSTPTSSKLDAVSVDMLDLDFSSTKPQPSSSDKPDTGLDLLGDLPSPVSKSLALSLPFANSFGSSPNSSTVNSDLGSEILITAPKIQIDAVGDRPKSSPSTRNKSEATDGSSSSNKSKDNSGFGSQFTDLDFGTRNSSSEKSEFEKAKLESGSNRSGVGTNNPLVKPPTSSSGGNSPALSSLPRRPSSGSSSPVVPRPSPGGMSPIIALPRPPGGAGRRRQRPPDSPLISLNSPSPPPTVEAFATFGGSPDPSKRVSPSNTSQSLGPQMPAIATSLRTNTSAASTAATPTPSTTTSATPTATPTVTPTATPTTSTVPPLQPSSSTPKGAKDAPTPAGTPAAASSTDGGDSDAVPLALAFIETANVIFNSSDLSKSMVKVSGELAVSFPVSSIGQLLIHEEFKFILQGDLSRLKNLLHNTQFVVKESKEGSEYRLDMEKLFMNLSQKSADNPQATYHNLLALKYEVSAAPQSFPVQVACQWTRGPTEDKAEIDYRYLQPRETAAQDAPHPTLQGMLLTLPVGGGVEKATATASGVWSSEHNKMVWKLAGLPPGDKGSIEVAFQHKEASHLEPSNLQVQFSGEGLSLSGLGLSIPSSGYRISLLKKKVSSGRYECDLSHQQS